MSDAEDTEALLDATTALLPPLLTALEALNHTGRRLHPPDLPGLVAAMHACEEPLAAGLRQFESVAWPARLELFETRSRAAAGHALEALSLLGHCLERSNPAMAAYRAMGSATRAVEALYPVSFMLPPVNRFFLCPDQRDDDVLQQALLGADLDRDDVGILHAGNEASERGGFSVYVPEYHDAREPVPLVMALHGGSGHGRSFLWTWLREARSRDFILVTPTARQDTWSLMGPDVDTANLLAMVDYVRSRWAVDEERMLLTGMSDGGTFSYVSGLREDSPFTHLAPISATFHPMLMEGASARRIAGLPVYLVHGALDWMFPVDVARLARDALTAAGADVAYRELDDLSHTYPREENVRILEWLTRTL